jgi:hypothetical protein
VLKVSAHVARSRLDSSLEAAGAEFLVLSSLLIEGIQAFKAYTNFPGYDLIATNPEKNLSCRIQVKSRWATDWDRGFPIKNFDCDFVTLVALNRGYRYHRRARPDDSGRRAPEVWVFPIEVVKDVTDVREGWQKANTRNIADLESYLDNWGLVRMLLQMGTP